VGLEHSEVPFNVPYVTGEELSYLSQAIRKSKLSGGGYFSNCVSNRIAQDFGSTKALLTHSGTAALEMAALLAELVPGDEVIMPSYTFVTTASAFALRGAIPVFVDIRPDTLCIDEEEVLKAITNRTKALVIVHYAGGSPDMARLMAIAEEYNLFVIEDAAQAYGSTFAGRPLGSFGHVSCVSFHETKNISSGEGGALIVNDQKLIDKAQIVLEKGTNRSKFLLGQEDKYTWLELGSSFQPSEVTAAFLWPQLLQAMSLLARRRKIWNVYFEGLKELSAEVGLPNFLESVEHNGHIFFLVTSSQSERDSLISFLRQRQIMAVFHYVPLHSSPAGRVFGKTRSSLPVTDYVSSTLLRLPMWYGVEEHQARVVSAIHEFFDTDVQRSHNPDSTSGV
jgi:dTDP-4-amino-4,6-dideoxygalactose transaminase